MKRLFNLIRALYFCLHVRIIQMRYERQANLLIEAESQRLEAEWRRRREEMDGESK